MKLLPQSISVLAVAIVGLGVLLAAQRTNEARPKRISVPYDWSHRHVVYSRPATLSQAWKLQQEPRYWHQMLRRNAVGRVVASTNASELEFETRQAERLFRLNGSLGNLRKPFQRDWAQSLGSGASTGTTTFPQYPAKFTFDVTQASISCADFVAFPTNVPGVTGVSEASPGQPSIIAFENLYSGPGGTGPCNTGTDSATVAWAYNTNASGDTTGVVSGSPTLSADGTKIAFVESNASGSVLHLLQFIEFDGVDNNGVMVVITPTNIVTSGGWAACPPAQSCMINLTFSAGTAANSSPFYNFSTDELYAGDDSGVLHKFSGVFNGTPAEVTTGGWPISVSAGALTPPVLDSVSHNIFVGDSSGILSYVREVGSSAGACASGVPPCLGSTTVVAAGSGLPIIDPPMLDPTTGKVFVFVGNSGTISGFAQGAYVVQTNVDLSGVVRQIVGRFGAPLHAGAFDNTYLNSSPGSIAGFLWVCGKGASDVPTLRRLGFGTDGTIGAVSPTLRTLGSVTGAAGQCSPVTEIFNPNVGAGTDFIFLSVQSGDLAHIGPPPGNATNCPGTGCVMSADVTSGAVPTHVAASLGELGGTSGIIIDNVGTDAQESNIYLTRLKQSALSTCGGAGATLVGCAVKLTQSGLN